MRILIIEDDNAIATSIQDSMGKRYVVDIALRGLEGVYKACINDYDLIILDYMLPDIDGLHVCRQIREASILTPIIFVTARFTIRDKVRALDAGADDYLVKPFSFKELLARIRALLRRHAGFYTKDVLHVDNMIMDTNQRTVYRAHRRIRLRKRAFDLLEYLLRNQDRVLSRSTILEHVWEGGTDEMTNTVDVHIKYLRDKIDRPYNSSLIQTVHGVGYKITSGVDIAEATTEDWDLRQTGIKSRR